MPDRKTEGDFACYIALFLALEQHLNQTQLYFNFFAVFSGLFASSVVLFVLPRKGGIVHDTKKTTEQRKQSGSESIDELKQQFETLKIEEGNKIFMFVTALASVVALILSALHFFI